MTSVEKRIDDLLNSLKLEHAAEEEELADVTSSRFSARQLQRAGKAFANQSIQAQRTGLFGRCVISCGPLHGGALPVCEIGHGDPVMVRGQDKNFSGFVFKVSELTIDLCVDMDEDEKEVFVGMKVDIFPSVNDITYRRVKKACQEIRTMTEFPRLIESLLGNGQISEAIAHASQSCLLTPPDKLKHLNKEQKDALKLSVTLPELFCLHGPPGTGKTTTITSIISEQVARKTKVIVCCPSNAAVDVLVDKLARAGVKVLRLGHPARTSPHLQGLTLDAQINSNEMLQDIKKELYAAKGRERGILRKELRGREQKVGRDLLQTSDVIVATCTVVGSGSILDLIEDKEFFGIGIVDEAGQATEPAIYPILRRCSKKLILAGDPQQLPPTIISHNARLGKTLLEDAMKRFPQNVCKLKRQYRMNKLISNWISKSMYGNELIADESVQNHTLEDIREKDSEPVNMMIADFIKNPLNMIDTMGADICELDTDADQSKSNPGEAAIVATLVHLLLKSGISMDDIAIISPYSAQVQLITSLIPSKVRCRTVDGYQGGEAELIIISMVRSNSEGVTGFLADKRRLNVAVSRARRSCCIIGDTGTITKVPFIENLVEYFFEHSNIISPTQIQEQAEWTEFAEKAGFVATKKTVFHDHLVDTIEEPEIKSPKKKVENIDNKPKIPKKLPKSKMEKTIEKIVQEKISPIVEMLNLNEAKRTGAFENLELVEEKTEYINCPTCKKSLPKDNLQMHEIHCARLQRIDALNPVKPTEKTNTKKAKKNKPKIAKNTKSTDFDNIENDDDLLEKAMATAGNCAFGSCKNSVRVIGYPCTTCSKHFCGTHKFPELHGCRPTAYKSAPGHSKQIQRKRLENKMNDKLSTLEKGRETKKKNEKKK